MDEELFEIPKDCKEIYCPECKKWSLKKQWSSTEVSCEDCGTHEAIRCPECDEDYDHVWGKERLEYR